ncbi:hypothetical protein [Methanoculleus sp.]|nr:hypothetical protein [Methanoculleus sp.]MCK9320291.1 hypothetical protein [Methanoculleus sp.]
MKQEILDKLPVWMQDILKLDAEIKADKKPIVEANTGVESNGNKKTS